MVWGCGRGYEKWDPPPRRLGSTWAGGEKLCQINLGREAEASLPKFICKPPPPHRRTVRPGVGVRFFFKDSPRSERSRRSLKKEDISLRGGPKKRVFKNPTKKQARGGKVDRLAFFFLRAIHSEKEKVSFFQRPS